MKRIAIASRLLSGFNGATTAILEHARRLSQSGWEVHLYGEEVDTERAKAAGAIAHRIPRWPWGSYAKRRIFDWLFHRASRRTPFDLICGHGDILDQDFLVLHNCVHAAHEFIHGGELPRSSGVGRIHARMLKERRFRHVVANSELMKRDIVRRFAVAQSDVSVVYPGHNPARFKLEDRSRLGVPTREEIGVRQDDFLVGLITSGDFRKRGVDIFISTLATLPTPWRDKARGLIVGKETRLKPYRELAHRAGVADRIQFLPPQDRIERFYHALDVYFFPALFEEFGQSVQEAMACGIPVLTSLRVGAAELFKGQWRDLVVQEPDAAAFAARLSLLLQSEDARAKYKEGALVSCRGNTWEENSRKILERCESLLA